jgi:ribosome-binding protein aMBF1 (putative translation factor)
MKAVISIVLVVLLVGIFNLPSRDAASLANPQTKTDVIRPLSEQIRHARLSRGWTIKDVSARVGLTPEQIEQIEKGSANPQPATLQKFEQAFNVRFSNSE